MSYIFDSSAIFKAIKENAIEFLAGNLTLNLTRYEMGNIIWKEYTIHKRIDRQEALKIIKIFKDALSLMENLAINCNEEEILKIADDLKITFYDAAYIYYAKSRGIPLITEDRKLMEKAEQHVKILKFEDII